MKLVYSTNSIFRLFVLLGMLFVIQACTKDRVIDLGPQLPPGDEQLMYYWSFNNTVSLDSLIAPVISIGTNQLNYEGAFFDEVNDGTEINARSSVESGSALRLRNPSDYLDIEFSTSGYKDIVIQYATMRTNSGAMIQQILYSTDGSTFINSGIEQTEFSIGLDWELKVINLKPINAANNNADFRLRLKFAEGSENPSGNNRIDNLTIEGLPF